jgi:hypothetical protein
MAVVARRVQHRSNLRRRPVVRHQIVDDGRLYARGICELQQGEAYDERDEKPFQFSFQKINRFFISKTGHTQPGR